MDADELFKVIREEEIKLWNEDHDYLFNALESMSDKERLIILSFMMGIINNMRFSEKKDTTQRLTMKIWTCLQEKKLINEWIKTLSEIGIDINEKEKQ